LSQDGEPGRQREPRTAGAEGEGRATGGDEAAAQAAQAAPAAVAEREEEVLGFRQAMDELEGILQRIEGEEIDIDQLAEELRRAAKLLDLCRGKIRRAEVEVTQIVQSLEESGEGDESH
jgi:exodeoxyribonuclease VII small subunit